MYEALTGISQRLKRFILLSLDTILIVLALYCGFALRLGTPFPFDAIEKSWLLFPVVTAAGFVLLLLFGLSRVKISAFERNAILRTGVVAVGLTIVSIIVSFIFSLSTPRSVPLIAGIAFFVGNLFSRLSGQYLIEYLAERGTDRKRALIYGAGQAGIQLVSALRQTHEVRPVLFVDDNLALSKSIISGLPVVSTQKIKTVIADKKIDLIILAIPSITNERRAVLLKELSNFDCEVQTLPSFVDLIGGKGLVESLKPVSPDDLLGRDKVDLNSPEIINTYANKIVMVTGAGGSIGSELCRQLLSCDIAKLVLFDHSEFALYSVERNLRQLANETDLRLTAVLGSVTDKQRVEFALLENNVQIVLHAAAYKHVPLVEDNEIVGLHNNVIGTQIVASAARQLNLERFILISTDKAVRPTNVMGASKRLAELVVQDFAAQSKSTLFSMVRFGNVLGSSGSVIPLFTEQIAKGGPVTLTHRDVTRFFMTIPEAACLVLLAGSYSSGGEVFVLDMGAATKIYDLACSMIKLSGRAVRDQENREGDIEIKITGLRPGEKLYEELLIGSDMLATPHPKILRAQENSLSKKEMAKVIEDLTRSFGTNDTVLARATIARWVEGAKISTKSCSEPVALLAPKKTSVSVNTRLQDKVS